MLRTMLSVEELEMNALTYTHTRQHFAEVMRQVNDNHEYFGDIIPIILNSAMIEGTT